MSLSIPKGTRDYSPQEMVKRNYIFDTIKNVFKLHGFQQIETPAMENLSTLMGKYGEEGDKLLFKVMNAREEADKIDRGLRYDLTVPFARYVVMHRNEINFPFKRFQIQPVWRGDRPQKGRYREFFQCDVDVIGSNSLLNEVELIQIVDSIFKELKIEIVIKLNNRKVLSGIAELMGQSERLTDITVAIDKIDKIGLEAVKSELYSKDIKEEHVKILEPILTLAGNNGQKLEKMREILSASETGIAGLNELATIFNYIKELEIPAKIDLDLSLARGLNYYTGAIIEVKALNTEIGSICGGGRYDNLTGIFGMKDVSGVGISFGADRIYDVLTVENLFPENSMETIKALFVNMGEKEELYCLKAMKVLRDKGIVVEMYPDNVKLKKQIEYADKRNIQFVVIAGENEMQNQTFTLKDITLKTQDELSLTKLLNKLIEK